MEKEPIGNMESYLSTLPIREMLVADKRCKVRYDDSTETVYLIDEHGSYTGQWSHYKFEDTAPQRNEDSLSPDLEDGEETGDLAPAKELEEDISEPEPQDARPEADPEATKKKKRFLGLIAAVVVICLAVLAMEVRGKIAEQQPEPSTEQMATEESEVETETTEEPTEEETQEEVPTEASQETEQTEAINYVHVLIAAEDLLPGDVLDDDSFSYMDLTEAEYQQLCVAGTVFTEDDVARLTGMECTSYVRAGQCIPQDGVANSYTAVNPWGRDSSRQSVIILPIDVSAASLADVAWGQYVDLEVTVETRMASPNISTTPTEGEESSETVETTAPAVEHHTSVVESTIVDTYKLQAAAIVDLLDAEGNSLYEQFSVWCNIPAPFQSEVLSGYYASVEDLQADLPYYICIAIPAEQASILEAIETERMSVVASNPTPCIENDLQQSTYAQLQQVMAVISDLWYDLEVD